MWGAVGAMVAVPLLILLYTFGQRIPALSPLASMIGPTEGESDDDKDAEEDADAEAETEEMPQAKPASALDPGAPLPPRLAGSI